MNINETPTPDNSTTPKKRGPRPGEGGGARPGSGRPKTDQKFVSQNVRIPEDLMNEANKVGIVKGSFTKHVVSGLKKEIKALKKTKK